MVSKYLSDSGDLDDYSKEGFKMKANQRSANIDIKEKISILWIVVMINMIFADILSFMLPGFLNDINTGNTPFGITQKFCWCLH